MASLPRGLVLNHIARETSDVNRLASFYQEVLGFERIDAPNFGEFQVAWLKLPTSPLSIHLIESNPHSNLREKPYGGAPVRDPSALPRGHHIAFGISDYEEFAARLKERGIETFEKTQPDGKTKQLFFFDPDGNGIEVGSWSAPPQ